TVLVTTVMSCTHTLPPLPFAPDALEPYMSKETLEYHYGKHHHTYVTNLNSLVAGTPYEPLGLVALIRTAALGSGVYNNAAQVWNHTFFWHSLRPGGGGVPEGPLLDAILKKWGSFDEFKKVFHASAVGNFGSGWTWLVRKPDGTLDVVNTGAAGTP